MYKVGRGIQVQMISLLGCYAAFGLCPPNLSSASLQRRTVRQVDPVRCHLRTASNQLLDLCQGYHLPGLDFFNLFMSLYLLHSFLKCF
jgi:hypothetical protein